MDDMDKIYREVPLEESPWNSDTPPDVLVSLVESQEIKPCKTIDLGCGAGNYAIYLAGKGFDVTGVDISPTAIEIAKVHARMKGVKCEFITADVLGNLREIEVPFEFAYDWALLHHLFPENRKQYVENIHRILRKKAKYLSICFSEQETAFDGSGKYRTTSLGTTLYFSSEDELRDLFSPYFHIKELKTIEIEGKFATHMMNYVFMEK